MTDTNYLNGKTALVTGGGRGIGAAIARRLAAHGATVLVHYGHSADAAETLAAEINGRAIMADLAADDGPAKLAGQVEGGGLDVLVNNAGVYPAGPLAELDEQTIRDGYAINVLAPLLVTKHLTPKLNDNGRLIFIGSCVGERMPFPGGAVYAGTKGAIKMLSQGLSRELGGRGITVNNVEPGPIDTDMNPDSPDNPGQAMMKSMTPLGRYGKADEVAALVAFLASPDAAYITGGNYLIDGGFNA